MRLPRAGRRQSRIDYQAVVGSEHRGESMKTTRIIGAVFLAFGIWVITWGTGGFFFPTIGSAVAVLGALFVIAPRFMNQVLDASAKQQQAQQQAQERRAAGLPTADEDKARISEIARGVTTLAKLQALQKKIDQAQDKASNAQTDRTEQKWDHEVEILEAAADRARDYVVGWRTRDEGEIYDTEEEARKHLTDEDEDDPWECTLGELDDEE
jgi:hypothetical protein